MQSISMRYSLPRNRFYDLWSSQRPPASLGVYKVNTDLPDRFKPHRILIILARIFVLERFEINDEHREENNDDNGSPVHPAPFKKRQGPVPDHTFCILPEFFAP